MCLLAASCGLNPRDDNGDDNKLIYINIPDPAFEKACLAACDLDGDGRVSRYEAQRLSDLSCPDAGIITTEGIGEFINLRNFDCAGNELTSLDMRNCRQLRALDCSRNQLVTLDVRGLFLLLSLRCADNELVSLDLADSRILSTIVCAGNRLVTLDIAACARSIDLLNASRNPDLTTLYLSEGQYIYEQVLDGQTEVVVRR